VESALFVGTLRHRRFTPRPHAFTYRLFMAFMDIDRIPDLIGISRLTSVNRWNWASFHDADHFGDPRLSLRDRLTADATRAGITLPDGPIFLLTHLRYLGYCFNPVSFYYAFDRRGRLHAMLAEVNNTFGGAHNYWLIPGDSGADRGPFHATAEKSLYVSPFLPTDLDYGFWCTRPAKSLVVHMTAARRSDVVLDATLRLERRPWTAREIRRQLMRQPVATVAVTAAIHWEALKLWVKGVPVQPRATPDGVGERAARRDGLTAHRVPTE
jgi:DUF1365 family protein